MKKLLLFLITVLSILLCCSCGSAASEQNSGTPPEENSTSQEDGGVNQENKDHPTEELIGYRIKVGPELTIYFDAEGIVQQVELQNSDAEEVCNGLSLTGISCQEALNCLVEQMAALDMIEGAKGPFEVLLPVSEFNRRTYWAQEAVKVWSAALEKSNVSWQGFYTISMMS